MQKNIFTMKKLFTLILLLPAIAMQAETVQDTTFVYGNKQIVVSDTDEGTNVAVLDQDGDEFRKTSETKFVDGQEAYASVRHFCRSCQRNGTSTEKPISTATSLGSVMVSRH